MRLLRSHRLLPLVRLDNLVHLRRAQCRTRRFGCLQVSSSCSCLMRDQDKAPERTQSLKLESGKTKSQSYQTIIFPVFRFSGFPIFRFPVFRFSGFPVFRFSGFPIFAVKLESL